MDLGTTWALIDTPDPNEYGFMTMHDPDAVAGWSAEMGDNGRPIREKTLYKNWFMREPARVPLWGDYVYVGKSFRDDGAIVFLWFKFKTELEKLEPYDTWTEQGNHYWPGVLHAVDFYPDRNFPVSANGTNGGLVFAARLYDRIRYTPPVSEGSLFQTDVFFSGTKFAIGQSPVPIPTAVSWKYHDSSGSFPECLHGRLIFPSIQSAFKSYTTGGGTVDASGASASQLFPSTAPFEDWQPYVASDKQEQVMGGWKRTRVTVYPPPAPDTISK